MAIHMVAFDVRATPVGYQSAPSSRTVVPDGSATHTVALDGSVTHPWSITSDDWAPLVTVGRGAPATQMSAGPSGWTTVADSLAVQYASSTTRLVT